MASNTGGRPISSKYLRPTSRPPEVSPTGSDASLSTPTQRGGSGELVGRGGGDNWTDGWKYLVSTRHVIVFHPNSLSLLSFPLPPLFNLSQRPSLAILPPYFILPSPSLPLSSNLSPPFFRLSLPSAHPPSLILLSVPSDSSSLPEEVPLLITSTSKHSPRPSKSALQEEDHEVHVGWLRVPD